MNQVFKIGDRVLISKTSGYYIDGDKCNPKNVEGTITSCNDNYIPSNKVLNIAVIWDNGRKNWYNTKDLELVNKSASKIEVKEEVKEEKPKKRRLLIG